MCSIFGFVGWNDSVDLLKFFGVIVSCFDAFLIDFIDSF